MFHVKIGIGLQGANPVDQLPGRRLFLNCPELSHLIKGPDRTIHEVLADVREMDCKDFPHHVRLGEGNVMEIAATQKRIGQVLLGVGCDNNHRPFPGFNGFVDFNDIKFHLVQDIQHVILEIRICLIDLVDQKNHPFIRYKGLADLSHLDILFDITDISLGVTETAVIEPGEGIILVQGLYKFHARFDI